MKHNGTSWFWTGRETTLLSTTSSLWDYGQPGRSDGKTCGCVCMDLGSYNRLLDCVCNAQMALPVCEKDAE